MNEEEQLTEFQLLWCVVMTLALGVAAMDVAIWRKKPEPEPICKRSEFSHQWRKW